MPAQDVSFTFDPKPFQKGVQQVNKSMGNMQSQANNVASGMSLGIGKIVRRLGTMAAGFVTIRGAIRSMPEIGQAFSMAGEVLTKNLLWPLRQALFPLLQNMLDWVREHRAMFVRWGKGLLGIFKGAVEIGKVFWDVLKNVGNTLRQVFGQRWAIFNRSISDTLNLLQFKMVLVAHALRDVFEQVREFWIDSGLQSLWNTAVDAATRIVNASVELAKQFGAGFATRLGDIRAAFTGLVGAVENLINAIFGGDGNGLERAKDIMYEFGQIMGDTVEAGFLAASDVINQVAENIRDLREAIGTGDWARVMEHIPFFGNFIEAARRSREGGEDTGYLEGLGRAFLDDTFIDELWRRGVEAFTNNPEQQDFMMRPGQPPVSFSPQDTIVGMKNPGGMGGASVSVDMSGTQIYVTEGNAREAGRRVGSGIAEEIRDQLLRDMTRAGE